MSCPIPSPCMFVFTVCSQGWRSVGPRRKFSCARQLCWVEPNLNEAGWFESTSGDGTGSASTLLEATFSSETQPHTPIHPHQRLFHSETSSGPPHDLVAKEAVSQPRPYFDWRTTHPLIFYAHAYVNMDQVAVCNVSVL